MRQPIEETVFPVSLAVLLPCYNEATSVGRTIESFRATLPQADIYVYDNNSTDGTAEVALAHGAIVRRERLQGKGHVVRRMFADVQADIYILADGDGTYDASASPAMVSMMLGNQLDMIVGNRIPAEGMEYRKGHRFGNAMLTQLLARLFGRSFSDILSGYRVFSRRFVKSFPLLSSGFEIETEICIHALEMRMPVGEMQTKYFKREDGSDSKLHTIRDGIRILFTMVTLFRNEKPLVLFGSLSAIGIMFGIGISVPLAITYAESGLVPRLPTAILATGLAIVSVLCLFAGLILDTVVRGRREMRRLAYLQHDCPSSGEHPVSLQAESHQRRHKAGGN